MMPRETADRAAQTWRVLKFLALNGRTVTYSDLATLIGLPGHQRQMGRYLFPLLRYCRRHKLPTLTIIVVRSWTGKAGFVPDYVADEREERSRVMAHNLNAVRDPEAEELE